MQESWTPRLLTRNFMHTPSVMLRAIALALLANLDFQVWNEILTLFTACISWLKIYWFSTRVSVSIHGSSKNFQSDLPFFKWEDFDVKSQKNKSFTTGCNCKQFGILISTSILTPWNRAKLHKFSLTTPHHLCASTVAVQTSRRCGRCSSLRQPLLRRIAQNAFPRGAQVDQSSIYNKSFAADFCKSEDFEVKWLFELSQRWRFWGHNHDSHHCNEYQYRRLLGRQGGFCSHSKQK